MRSKSINRHEEVESLLAGAGLPVADLATAPGLRLFGVREASRLVGVFGIEPYGQVGLLRSLAVAFPSRKSGLGTALVSDAETWAAEHGINTLYLLTTTAAGFFARLGYEAIPRSQAPEPIRATAQFSELCPSSSTFMRKALAANNALQARPP